jgi:hypothetical protein
MNRSKGVRSAAWRARRGCCIDHGVPVVYWVTAVCDIRCGYTSAMASGQRHAADRSFAEPARADMNDARRRSKAWLLGPLFLFNNLHSLHHADGFAVVPLQRVIGFAWCLLAGSSGRSIRRISRLRGASCSGCTIARSIPGACAVAARRGGVTGRSPRSRQGRRSPPCRPPRSLRSAACPRIP